MSRSCEDNSGWEARGGGGTVVACRRYDKTEERQTERGGEVSHVERADVI